MPYIDPVDRIDYNENIDAIVETLDHGDYGDINPGDVNYVISKIIWSLFDKRPCYSRGNDLIGALECVKQEFYRRRLVPLEDEKIIENGDIV